MEVPISIPEVMGKEKEKEHSVAVTGVATIEEETEPAPYPILGAIIT